MSQTKSGIHSVLEGFKIPELDDIKHFFGARVPGGMKKAEYVEKLSGFIITKPKVWLSKMLERDLRLLKTLVQAGPGVSIYTEYPDYPSVLETIKLIDADSSDENFRRLSISKELFDIVAPCIDAVIDRGEQNGRFRLERIALGILNVYGVMLFDDFVNILWKHVEGLFNPEDTDKFMTTVYAMPLVKVTLYEKRGKGYISSPCLSAPEKLFKERRKEYSDVENFKEYSTEEYLNAGKDAPYFVFGEDTQCAKDVFDMLLKLGYNETDARREMHDMWMSSQYIFDDSSTEALLSSVSRRQDNIPSFEKYTECMQLVASYANSLPKWLLKGHTPTEANLLKVILNIDNHEDEYDDMDDDSMGSFELPEPTVSEGFIQAEDALAEFSGGLFNALPRVLHVAKDDPCPCGSGLRYRNCHGKYLS